jgi:hypothetical protein
MSTRKRLLSKVQQQMPRQVGLPTGAVVAVLADVCGHREISFKHRVQETPGTCLRAKLVTRGDELEIALSQDIPDDNHTAHVHVESRHSLRFPFSPTGDWCLYVNSTTSLGHTDARNDRLHNWLQPCTPLHASS